MGCYRCKQMRYRLSENLRSWLGHDLNLTAEARAHCNERDREDPEMEEEGNHIFALGISESTRMRLIGPIHSIKRALTRLGTNEVPAHMLYSEQSAVNLHRGPRQQRFAYHRQSHKQLRQSYGVSSVERLL
jgi:hypothetical protein